GRVTSVFQLIQSVFQILFILAIGFLADLISLKLTIVSLAVIMMITAIVYSLAVLNPKYSGWYEEETQELKKARMI
ncbi:MAG: MFS transporter, partial [Planococcus donghaensis]